MDYDKKPDANQAEIIEAAQKLGVCVRNVSWAGRGLLDLICSDWTGTWLVDCKSKYGKLTGPQKRFLTGWPGDWDIWRSPEDVIKTVTERRSHG